MEMPSTKRRIKDIEKAAWYLRMYGLSRTWAKVRAKRTWARPVAGTMDMMRASRIQAYRRDASQAVAFIGSGNYAQATTAFFVERHSPGALRAVMDVDLRAAQRLSSMYGGSYATDDAGEVLRDGKIDLVFIQSNHATHAGYAVEALAAGKAVHIEKPIATSHDDLLALTEAMREPDAPPVFLGFNRPRSPHSRRLASALALESGPLSMSAFVVGHEIAESHWYNDPKEGGRILGNLCHWLDLSIFLVGLENYFPCIVYPGPCGEDLQTLTTSVLCGDGSTIVAVLSVKKEPLRGIGETITVHRGDLVAQIYDFERLKLTLRGRSRTCRSLFRDHGHSENFRNSLAGALCGTGESIRYVAATGALALAAQDALVQGRPQRLTVASDGSWTQTVC